MIELISDVIISNKVKMLNLLRATKLYISTDNKCVCVTMSSVSSEESLKSDQEEADTKVILHCLHAMKENPDLTVTLQSPSGDTDIFILAVCLLQEYKNAIYLDDGSGRSRRIIWLGNIDLEDNITKFLIGFHALTGNDFVSSFFFVEERKSVGSVYERTESSRKHLHR